MEWYILLASIAGFLNNVLNWYFVRFPLAFGELFNKIRHLEQAPSSLKREYLSHRAFTIAVSYNLVGQELIL